MKWKSVLFIIFLILFILSGIQIYNYIKEGKANQDIINDLSSAITMKENNEYKIDFEQLKDKNPDTVGFLKVNGTQIEFVVVKGNDNDYYLTHNFEKQVNADGWVFADYKNILDGTDKNIVIYGHNMKNGMMFASLKNVLEKSWQENKDNREVLFITPTETAVYSVFSVYEIENEEYYLQTNFADKRI